jgi:hypothetical protein
VNEVKTQLLQAARCGDREATRRLLENGVNYNEIFIAEPKEEENCNAKIMIDNKEYTLADLHEAIRKAECYDDLCQ